MGPQIIKLLLTPAQKVIVIISVCMFICEHLPEQNNSTPIVAKL